MPTGHVDEKKIHDQPKWSTGTPPVADRPGQATGQWPGQAQAATPRRSAGPDPGDRRLSNVTRVSSAALMLLAPPSGRDQHPGRPRLARTISDATVNTANPMM